VSEIEGQAETLILTGVEARAWLESLRHRGIRTADREFLLRAFIRAEHTGRGELLLVIKKVHE
jgi:hypothetical protein